MDPLVRGLNGVILVSGLGLFVVSVGYLLWQTHARRSGTDDQQAEDDAVSSTDGGAVVGDTGGFVFGDDHHSDRNDADTTDEERSG